jgi:hypothetical protein
MKCGSLTACGFFMAAVNAQTNISISSDWDDIRYGTLHISTADRWGNCVAVTLSMAAASARKWLSNHRRAVLGQGMAPIRMRARVGPIPLLRENGP